MRRPLRLGSSTFTIERQRDGWGLTEVWWELTRHGDKTDMQDAFGPYPDRDAAEAERARLEKL